MNSHIISSNSSKFQNSAYTYHWPLRSWWPRRPTGSWSSLESQMSCVSSIKCVITQTTMLSVCCAVLCRGVWCSAVLCSAVLHCAVLCYTVHCIALQCCAVLCCAVPCRAVPCSAVQCSAVLCGAVLWGAVQCSAVQCSAVQCSAVLCCAVLCCAVLHGAALPCRAVPCRAVPCNAMHYYFTFCKFLQHLGKFLRVTYRTSSKTRRAFCAFRSRRSLTSKKHEINNKHQVLQSW